MPQIAPADKAQSAQGRSPGEIFISPTRGWRSLDLAAVFTPPDLLKFMVWRDLKVRYRQTFLGGAWAVLQPLLTVLIFTVVFGRLVKVPSDGVPYPLFSFAALAPWMYFSGAVTQAANSVVNNSQLIEKIYFPRLTIPISAVISGLLDLGISLAFLLLLMTPFGYYPSVRALLCLPLIALSVLTAVGVGSMLSALNVRFRDVRHVLPFAMQIWLFATPIAYPSSLVPEPWRPLLGLNPMAGVVEGFRWALLGVETNPWPMLAVSTVSGVFLCLAGLFFFRRMERGFADVI